jgi:voltage-gated potassium channel Kch
MSGNGPVPKENHGVLDIAREHEWRVAFGAGTLAFVLGWIGFGQHNGLLDAAYLSLQLFVLQSGAVENPGVCLEIARWLAPASVAYAAISTMLLISREQLQALALRTYRHHLVICGLGQKGARIATSFLDIRKDAPRIVVIERNPANPLVSVFREKGVAVVLGEATDQAVLRKARAEQADFMVCVARSDEDNLIIAERARELIRRRKTAGSLLRCLVHIGEPGIRKGIRRNDLFDRSVSMFDPSVFNIFEAGARALCHKFPLDVFHPVCRDEDMSPHALVVGFGRFGTEVVVQLGRTAHYINNKKTMVSVIDERGRTVRQKFESEYPGIYETLDLRFYQAAPRSLEATVLDTVAQDRQISACYLCVDADKEELAAYLRIESMLAERNIPVVVCIVQETGISTLLENRLHDSLHPECHIFNVFDHACSRENLFDPHLDRFARKFHEGYLEEERKRMAAASGEPGNATGGAVVKKRSLEDWDNLDEEYRDANRSLADHIDVKLRALRSVRVPADDPRPEFVFPADPESLEPLGRMEHARWCADRWLSGWRYGERRDDSRRTHNMLVPWEQLPQFMQQNDYDMVLRIPMVLRMEGEKAVKKA